MATGKRRQTFEKMNRERRVREKRALKAEKREQRKLGAQGMAQTRPNDDDAVEPTDSAVPPGRESDPA